MSEKFTPEMVAFTRFAAQNISFDMLAIQFKQTILDALDEIEKQRAELDTLKSRMAGAFGVYEDELDDGLARIPALEQAVEEQRTRAEQAESALTKLSEDTADLYNVLGRWAELKRSVRAADDHWPEWYAAHGDSLALAEARLLEIAKGLVLK